MTRRSPCGQSALTFGSAPATTAGATTGKYPRSPRRSEHRRPSSWFNRFILERFTDRARRVIVLAQGEARRLHQGRIGTEHLLLGLLNPDAGGAAEVLKALHVSPEAVRRAAAKLTGPSGQPWSAEPRFTPRAKKVLELALREALQLGHNDVGAEHLLLGVARGESLATEILTGLGVDLDRVRAEVLGRLASATAESEPPPRPQDELEVARREVEAARRFVRQLAAEVQIQDASANELVDRIAPLLARLHALHGEALDRLVQMIDAWRGEIFMESVRRDELVGPLLAAYGLASASSGHRFLVSEILQVMYWLRGEGFAEAVGPETIARMTGRSGAELEEWFELMTKMGLVERQSDMFRLTAEGLQEGSRLFWSY